MINAGAKRQQPKASDILSLASGQSGSTSSTRKTKGKSGSTSRRETRSASSAKSTTGTARAKRPCKYGPRGADGLCPKAPSRARNSGKNRTSVTARTSTGAAKQATDVILNPRASRQQKEKAVTKVAEVTATETAKTTIRKTVTPKRIERAKETVKKGAQAVAPYVIPTTGVVGAAVGGGYVASKLQKGRVEKQAEKMLQDTIKRTPPSQRGAYTPEVKAKLKKQYADHIRRQNEILFTK